MVDQGEGKIESWLNFYLLVNWKKKVDAAEGLIVYENTSQILSEF